MEEFDYVLPPSAIAQTPAEPRDAARLLVSVDSEQPTVHTSVSALPGLVGAGDLIVVNETRVMAARLELVRPTGGQAEVLLLEQRSGDEWAALVRPSRRIGDGARLRADGRDVVEVGPHLEGGRRLVKIVDQDSVQRIGRLPLPPYIHEPLTDPERYQTVYARTIGSAAAPTAGLHLTEEVLTRCQAAGARIATVDLAVGLDTFRPVTAERLEDHVMHSERYSVPPATAEACTAAQRVIAVGTTTVRALEAAAASGQSEGRTTLFLRPGHKFRVVDVLLTNFHLPRSSLLVLLTAFCGPRWRPLYEEALAQGYRFLSFGDAMLVGRSGGQSGGRRP